MREFTLTQQLMTIVLFVVGVFATFIFVFLSPAINHFTTNEMYRMLHGAQTSLVNYLDSNPGAIPEFIASDDSEITHVIYDTDQDCFYVLGEGEVPDFLQSEIRKASVSTDEGTKDYSLQSEHSSEDGVLYSITLLKDGRELISLLPSTYEGTFRNLLLNNIVNMNVIVAMLLFMILMLWVTTLIVPLNQIRYYINRIRKDEPAELTVNRHDEIGEVADAIRGMEDELQKQNREKQEMIQNISHDLKTPIATIRSYSESIKDGVYPYGTLENSVDVILEHANRLDKKVRSLITLNKMGYLQDTCEAGENLDMESVIRKTLLSLKVIRPDVRFEHELQPGVKFHGDEDSWRIVIENLVDNALRYAKSLVRIELHTGELKIINDGKPIEADRLGKLFKPYEKGTDGQFGLGLSIVYKIVSTYGYHVEAENLECGVCFRISRDLTEEEKREINKVKKKEDREQRKENRVRQKEERNRQKDSEKECSAENKEEDSKTISS